MSPLLWNDDEPPPPQDDGTLVFAFVVMTFALYVTVILGMMFRG